MTCGKYQNITQDEKRQDVQNLLDKFPNLVSQNANENWKMWKQLKTNRITNNVYITISLFRMPI